MVDQPNMNRIRHEHVVNREVKLLLRFGAAGCYDPLKYT